MVLWIPWLPEQSVLLIFSRTMNWMPVNDFWLNYDRNVLDPPSLSTKSDTSLTTFWKPGNFTLTNATVDLPTTLLRRASQEGAMFMQHSTRQLFLGNNFWHQVTADTHCMSNKACKIESPGMGPFNCIMGMLQTYGCHASCRAKL